MRKYFLTWIRLYNRFELRGVENLPKKGSAIIAGNHSGGLDLDNFTTMSALEHLKGSDPKRKRIWLCYWDKWAVEEKPWATWVQKFSPIPINLEGKGIPWKLVDKIVEKGELIAIMPEGHSASIKEGYRLWRFYPGVIKMHLKYKIPIIPTANIGFVKAAPIFGQKYDPKLVPPWIEEQMLPFILPKKLIIHYGKPLYFNDYYEKDPDKITKEQLFHLATIVRQKVKKQIEKYYSSTSESHPYGL